MRCIEVNPIFQEPIRTMYPVHQKGVLIEEYAKNFFREIADIGDAQYVPINWTGWFCNHGYGQGDKVLRQYVRDLRLPKGKYFTVVQNDDGTKCDDILHDIGCTIFACGGVGDIPLPLLCDAHPERPYNLAPKYLASFVGNTNTHPIRKKMESEIINDKRFFIGRGGSNLFRALMGDTVFALCPRGYGKTSYRLYEAIQLGIIPVYIYDEEWIPYKDFLNWSDFCVLIQSDMISSLKEILASITEQKRLEMRANLYMVQKYFTMKAACEYTEVQMMENN